VEFSVDFEFRSFNQEIQGVTVTVTLGYQQLLHDLAYRYVQA